MFGIWINTCLHMAGFSHFNSTVELGFKLDFWGVGLCLISVLPGTSVFLPGCQWGQIQVTNTWAGLWFPIKQCFLCMVLHANKQNQSMVNAKRWTLCLFPYFCIWPKPFVQKYHLNKTFSRTPGRTEHIPILVSGCGSSGKAFCLYSSLHLSSPFSSNKVILQVELFRCAAMASLCRKRTRRTGARSSAKMCNFWQKVAADQ